MFFLESTVTLWKTLIAIESKDNLMAILMQGSPRKILVEVTLLFLEETDAIVKSSYISCGVSIVTILKNLIFTYTNCLLANKVENHNFAVASKGIEKRFHMNEIHQTATILLLLLLLFEPHILLYVLLSLLLSKILSMLSNKASIAKIY